MEDGTITEGLSANDKGKEKVRSEVEESPHKMGGDDITPKEGMQFNSLSDVCIFYNNYARQIGFGTKIRSTWREEGEVTRCTITCVQEGKANARRDADGHRESDANSTKTSSKVGSKTKVNARWSTKLSSRIGCKAKVNARRDVDGVWFLTKVNLEHNHMVSTSKARFSRCNKRLDKWLKKQLELNDTAGIPVCKSFPSLVARAGDLENLSFDDKDDRIYIEGARHLRLGEGDAEAIHQYFMRMHKQNSNFYHVMDIDNEGRLKHVFWADARSRISYQYFGDVISFDTIYLTRYDMPFALFLGVNHHGQSVLLGCGLLSSESMDSYVWLFKSWLSCMSGRPPNAIITDQCKSIQGAVSEVFPRARHRLCLWHIMKKVPEKFGDFKEREAIVRKLKKAVYDSLKIEEFEQTWGEMIEDFALQDNEWLRSLYEIRQKWVPVFVKDHFWAGMSTTLRNENVNAFFDSYVNSKTSLKQFISQYEVALERKYENEALTNFNSFHDERELVSNMPIEKQLRTVYTSNIFAKFQEEVKNVVNCRYTLLSQNGPLFIYDVKERMVIEGSSEPISKKFEVHFNAEKMEVHCICRSFEFRGILCKHAICVLDLNDVTKLPAQYILQRWRKDFKRLHGFKRSDEVGLFSCAPMDRYDDIYMHCHEIAEIGSMSDMKYKLALNEIKKLKDELLAFHEENPDNHPTGSVGCEETNTTRVIDPIQVKRKGRPRETVEKVVNAKKKKVPVGEVNNINQHDISLTQPSIGTQESINITEQTESIGSQVRVQSCFGNPPYPVGPMGHQGNTTFQQLMSPEWMRKFGNI